MTLVRQLTLVIMVILFPRWTLNPKQPLFSSEESAPAPLDQREPSSFGPMRPARRLTGRRQPAPMPEPLQALHRIVTAPAPVPSGRSGRDAADPAALSPPPPPPDHGNVDPGSIT